MMMRTMKAKATSPQFFKILLALLAAMQMGAMSHAQADGKLLGTGGIANVDGVAGGGITTWAVIGGYGERDQNSISTSLSALAVDDYEFYSGAINAGFANRVELSLAKQRLELPDDFQLQQTIIGMKLRLAGDLIYGRLPQLSLGVQHRRTQDSALLDRLQVNDRADTDAYLAVSRLFLAGPFDRSLLLNATLRSTRAQQNGLLGFSAKRSVEPELSAALLLTPSWAVGAEYRAKPDQLDNLGEDDWKTIFLAYFPNKQVSFAGAYVDLGSIAGRASQSGFYLTVQAHF
jgi:Protein of unknown function (DUF3034)